MKYLVRDVVYEVCVFGFVGRHLKGDYYYVLAWILFSGCYNGYMEDTKFSLNQTPISTILAWVESDPAAVCMDELAGARFDGFVISRLSSRLYYYLAKPGRETEGWVDIAGQAYFD